MHTTSPIVSDQSPPEEPRHPKDTIRALVVPLVAVVAVVVLVLDVVVVLTHEANKYFAFAPGSAPEVTASADCKSSPGGQLTLPNGTPCVRLVVPADLTHDVDGTLMMVDVLVGKATPWDWFLSQVGLLGTFEQGVQLIPAPDVLGTTPASQLACQDAQAMTDSTLSASVVALDHLGYTVEQKDLGAIITQVQPGSPAAAAGIECNDRVTAIDSTPVHTYLDLVNAIHAARPGQTVTVTVIRTEASGSTATKRLDATLGHDPTDPSVAYLGVGSQTDVTYDFPFPVSINVGAIGGPSAGLALTLGLLDALSAGQLTGGHRVAATGTMSVDGSVGDVGGVAQKTVAVRKAGAQIFLVPPQELATAKSEAGSMKVFAVSTIDQAISVLERFGGRLVLPRAKAAPAG